MRDTAWGVLLLTCKTCKPCERTEQRPPPPSSPPPIREPARHWDGSNWLAAVPVGLATLPAQQAHAVRPRPPSCCSAGRERGQLDRGRVPPPLQRRRWTTAHSCCPAGAGGMQGPVVISGGPVCWDESGGLRQLGDLQHAVVPSFLRRGGFWESRPPRFYTWRPSLGCCFLHKYKVVC